MNKHAALAVQIAVVAVMVLFSIAVIANNIQTNYVSEADVNKLVIELENIIKVKDFTILKKYKPTENKLTWDQCGSVDAGGFQYSAEAIIDKLVIMSKNAKILVHRAADTYVWNSKDEVSIVHIETEGWNDESPYLVFLFKFMNKTKRWEWSGVCHGNLPPSMPSEGKYEPIYKQKPTLPRKGPRVFKDSRNLRIRIEEILKFKAFDAIVPYAVNPELYFSECKSDLMSTFQMSGKKESAQAVVDFLKKNDHLSKSAIVMAGNREMYLDTKGWAGTYPNVSFWFTQSADGWQLSGVSYCKSSLFEMMFSDKK